MAIEPGQEAPDFELKDQDNNPVKLSDFKSTMSSMPWLAAGPVRAKLSKPNEKAIARSGMAKFVPSQESVGDKGNPTN